MLLYNITYLVSHEIKEEWLEWLKQHHAPEMMSTGLFSEFKILRLLDTDESEGITFAVQFIFPGMEEHDVYIAKHVPALRLSAQQRWGEKVLAFRTLMEIVQ